MQQKNREERKEVWRSSTGTGSSEAVGGATTVMASHQQGAAALLGPPPPGLRRRHGHTLVGQLALLLESGITRR